MAIIIMPHSARIQNIEWDLDQPAQVNRSDWTKRRQVIDQPGPALWSATADFVTAIGEHDALAAEAFLVDLEGQRNTFRLCACENEQIRVWAQEKVDGAGQSGRSLNLKGGVPNTGLRRGHKMTVGDQLVMIMTSFTFGMDGKAAVSFKPDLRVSPADNDAVELRFPTALVALTTSSVGWKVTPGQLYQHKSISVEEAF